MRRAAAFLLLALAGCGMDMPLPPDAVEATAPAASWGLDRINQRSLPLDGLYAPASAQGVTLYIVDTGLAYGHAELGGRAVPGFDAFGGNGSDTCHGHGTSVASTATGETFGVAPGAAIVSVKVFGCDGKATPANIVAGLNWIAANGVHPAVVNMSFAEVLNPLIDQAVNALWVAGYVLVAGGGNDAGDACDRTPARVPVVLTVAASRQDDTVWPQSNTGTCVDLFAPGHNIPTAHYLGGSFVSGGTSLATAHVSGVAALYMAAHPGASPQQVSDAILARATKGFAPYTFTNAPHLAYSGSDEMGWSAPPPLAVPQGLAAFVTGSHKQSGNVYAHTFWDWNDVPGTNEYTWHLQGSTPLGAVGSVTSTFNLTASTYKARVRAVGPYAVSGWTPWLTTQVCTKGSGKNGSAWIC